MPKADTRTYRYRKSIDIQGCHPDNRGDEYLLDQPFARIADGIRIDDWDEFGKL